MAHRMQKEFPQRPELQALFDQSIEQYGRFWEKLTPEQRIHLANQQAQSWARQDMD